MLKWSNIPSCFPSVIMHAGMVICSATPQVRQLKIPLTWWGMDADVDMVVERLAHDLQPRLQLPPTWSFIMS